MNSTGDNNYITDIVSTYSQTLFRAAYMVLHSQADSEDAVQDVFVKLIRKNPKFNNTEHEKAWLLRVTINTAKDILRKRKHDHLQIVQEVPDFDDNGNSDLLEAVLSLDEKYSTVIHLYYYEDYSITEIGKLLSLPAATVGTRLSRARDMLKNKLKGVVLNERTI
ncbi:MAG: sigma-70 family RNA polymerase sigma factor [Ruminococcus sp.]|nr:sigma-70 family RNA polymerase sigma factor [Ruminococcus sp.]